MSAPPDVEALLRRQTPRVLGALTRRHGHFDACEDAVQEALLAAVVQWPRDGVPDDPGAWLVTVASRRLTDARRSRDASDRRAAAAAAAEPADAHVARDPEPGEEDDDSLALLFLCCHPSLSPPSQLALTLRAVGGLTTAQIARAFLVPEATMAQRISRAKASIRAAGATFGDLDAAVAAERLPVVLHVVYLMFTEGHAASEGADVRRPLLTSEAIRLARVLRARMPDDGEVAGLLALMLLTEARGPARAGAEGALVPLAEQDRSRWDAGLIAEGSAIVADALARTPVGPYQLQAAIAAVHAEARSAEETDWAQIAALYALLSRLAPNPVVTLNHAVAVAMHRGPEAGLAMLADLEADDRLRDHHRLHAVRAHLHERAGDDAAARAGYERAAALTPSAAERDYLTGRARRLGGATG